MKKRIVFIAALLCGMCFTTASAQFKIGGKKINVCMGCPAKRSPHGKKI